ncbi:uncharacterized protein LOC128783121 [Vidua chalybeata]|uniref:uncharacterized protein LOC128783121 n=1 Tax=Vidua chalybeata TaxID=81927 RepID=UPI0023A7F468|nr:uncharacterized protein LOC128783121 [Vidua chalybeata]
MAGPPPWSTRCPGTSGEPVLQRKAVPLQVPELPGAGRNNGDQHNWVFFSQDGNRGVLLPSVLRADSGTLGVPGSCCLGQMDAALQFISVGPVSSRSYRPTSCRETQLDPSPLADQQEVIGGQCQHLHSAECISTLVSDGKSTDLIPWNTKRTATEAGRPTHPRYGAVSGNPRQQTPAARGSYATAGLPRAACSRGEQKPTPQLAPERGAEASAELIAWTEVHRGASGTTPGAATAGQGPRRRQGGSAAAKPERAAVRAGPQLRAGRKPRAGALQSTSVKSPSPTGDQTVCPAWDRKCKLSQPGGQKKGHFPGLPDPGGSFALQRLQSGGRGHVVDPFVFPRWRAATWQGLFFPQPLSVLCSRCPRL